MLVEDRVLGEYEGPSRQAVLDGSHCTQGELVISQSSMLASSQNQCGQCCQLRSKKVIQFATPDPATPVN